MLDGTPAFGGRGSPVAALSPWPHGPPQLGWKDMLDGDSYNPPRVGPLALLLPALISVTTAGGLRSRERDSLQSLEGARQPLRLVPAIGFGSYGRACVLAPPGDLAPAGGPGRVCGCGCGDVAGS